MTWDGFTFMLSVSKCISCNVSLGDPDLGDIYLKFQNISDLELDRIIWNIYSSLYSICFMSWNGVAEDCLSALLL